MYLCWFEDHCLRFFASSVVILCDTVHNPQEIVGIVSRGVMGRATLYLRQRRAVRHGHSGVEGNGAEFRSR